MSELSGNVGTEGEELVSAFLNKLGWCPLHPSFDLKCKHPKIHALPNKDKRLRHGVDLAFSYICPLSDKVRRNILISVKNSSKDNKALSAKQVKPDILDLDTALECFKKSENRSNFVMAGGHKTVEDHGVLFYLDKNPTPNTTIGSNLANSRIAGSSSRKIVIVDNLRYDFINVCLTKLQLEYPDHVSEVFCPRVSFRADSSQLSPNSVIFPYQYLSAGTLLFWVAESHADPSKFSDRKLVIFTTNSFSKENLSRLLALALNVSYNWVGVDVYFPDYELHNDSTAVSSVLQSLPNKSFASGISCKSSNLSPRL